MAQERWSVDGTSLHSYAYGIEAVSEGHGIPPIRGENKVVPFRHGSKNYVKYYGERRLSLMMYVLGAPADGGTPATSIEAYADLYSNLDTLRQLFGKRSSLLTLSRTLPDGSIRTGQAEVVGVMDFDNVRGGIAKFIVEMVMPDPFWYGTEETVVHDPWDATPEGFVVANDGNFDVTKMVITINDECQNPRVTLAGTSIYVEVLVAMVATDVLIIDTENYTATKNGSSVLGSLNHQGDPSFMKLVPGNNTLTMTSSIPPDADVEVVFKPVYL